MRSVFALAALFALIVVDPLLAQNRITGWKTSCGVDRGALDRKGNSYTFKPSQNHCDGGVNAPWSWKQRTEIASRKIKATTKGTYLFKTIVAMRSNSQQRFDVFQMHDGRKECAPPLKVEWGANNQVRLVSEYKIRGGVNDDCVPAPLGSKNFQRGQVLPRDGSKHNLHVRISFNGKGAFSAEVFVDGKLAVSGVYNPTYRPKSAKTIDGRRVANPEFELPKSFYFKHGVYARKRFNFVLTSEGMGMVRER